VSLRAKRGPETVSVLLWEGPHLLLVRRGPGGLFPHTWTLPGDELEAGESPEAGSRRVARSFGVEALETRVVRSLPQPSPLRGERGPDTVVEVVRRERSVSGKPEHYVGLGYFAKGDLSNRRMFREARQLILSLWRDAGTAGAA
jgi:hypothetical protein